MVKIRIVEHSGKEYLTEAENYNAEEIFSKIQNALSGNYLVLIGGVVIDARSINSISVIAPKVTEEEIPGEGDALNV